MLKITIDFTLDEILSRLKKEKWDYIQSEVNEGYHRLSFKINGNDIFEDYKVSRLGGDLKTINNVFFDLLKSRSHEPFNIMFDRLSTRQPFITVFKYSDKVVFLPTKYFPKIDETPIDLKQAMEEVIRVVNEYKDIMWQAANILMPNNIFGFMATVLGKEERYTKKYYDDPNFDWINFARRARNIKDDRSIIIYQITNAEEFRKKFIEVSGKKDGVEHVVISNYYDWFPLETAWNKYKKEHRI